MVGSQTAPLQSLDEVANLIRAAMTRRRPIMAIYEGRQRLLCPHMLGRNKEAGCASCAISMAAGVRADYSVRTGTATGPAFLWRRSATSGYGKRRGKVRKVSLAAPLVLIRSRWK